MARHTIHDLREHLFGALADLRDPSKNAGEAIERAKAIADVARVVVDTAKVQVEFMRVREDAQTTGFLLDAAGETTEGPARPQLEVRAGGRR